MGASNRNYEFAQLINRNFKPQPILVVADGKGELAKELNILGYQVRVIEWKPRWKKINGITYQKGWFDRDYNVTENLIVGMHPDEATAEIVLCARKHNINFAIVPCCVLGKESKGVHGFNTWISKLEYLAKESQKTFLKFGGKNLALWG